MCEYVCALDYVCQRGCCDTICQISSASKLMCAGINARRKRSSRPDNWLALVLVCKECPAEATTHTHTHECAYRETYIERRSKTEERLYSSVRLSQLINNLKIRCLHMVPCFCLWASLHTVIARERERERDK